MNETLVAAKSDLNDIFRSSTSDVTPQYTTEANGHARSDNFDRPISYFASHMAAKLSATYHQDGQNIMFDLHPISKGFDGDGRRHCKHKYRNTRDTLLIIHV